MKTTPIHEKDFKLEKEIYVFDIFNLAEKKLHDLYLACEKFSFKFRELTIYEDWAFKTTDPKYPLKKFKSKTIKIFQLQRDMSVREIKYLLDISVEVQGNFEKIFNNSKLENRNFILTKGWGCTMFFPEKFHRSQNIKLIAYIYADSCSRTIGKFGLIGSTANDVIIPKGNELGFLWD
ncbi:MAG: hypothetical protein ACOYMB_05340 [Patescibacteria group bacterium]